MIRNVKALGLVLVAVFATGGTTASAALATDLFTSSKEKVWVTGTSQNNVLKFTNPVWELNCATARFTGTVINKKSEATVLASYAGIPGKIPHGEKCETSLGPAKFDMNDCHYKLTGSTTSEYPKGSGKFDAAFWIECPAGKEITITVESGCTIHIPSQTPTEGGVTYENLPNHSGGEAVEIKATIAGITYSSSFVCQLSGIPAEADDADYNGTVTITGYEDKGGEMTNPIEGAQVPIGVS